MPSHNRYIVEYEGGLYLGHRALAVLRTLEREYLMPPRQTQPRAVWVERVVADLRRAGLRNLRTLLVREPRKLAKKRSRYQQRLELLGAWRLLRPPVWGFAIGTPRTAATPRRPQVRTQIYRPTAPGVGLGDRLMYRPREVF